MKYPRRPLAGFAGYRRSTQFRGSESNAVVGRKEYRCGKAIELYGRLRSTPTHFATQSEWRQFADAYGGAPIVLTSVLKEACDPSARQAATANMNPGATRETRIKFNAKLTPRSDRDGSEANAS